jgi:hypothetical protein
MKTQQGRYREEDTGMKTHQGRYREEDTGRRRCREEGCCYGGYIEIRGE